MKYLGTTVIRTIGLDEHMTVLLLIFLFMDRELNVVSFNCAGFKRKLGIKRRNYDYINDIFKYGDILFLQETWLHSFEHKLLLKKLNHANLMQYLLWMIVM